jgi:hypothetical protein
MACRGIASPFLKLSPRWKGMPNCMLWLFNPRGRAPVIHGTRGWVSPRAGLDILEKRKISMLCWNWTPDCLAHSLGCVPSMLMWLPKFSRVNGKQKITVFCDMIWCSLVHSSVMKELSALTFCIEDGGSVCWNWSAYLPNYMTYTYPRIQ